MTELWGWYQEHGLLLGLAVVVSLMIVMMYELDSGKVGEALLSLILILAVLASLFVWRIN